MSFVALPDGFSNKQQRKHQAIKLNKLQIKVFKKK